MALDQNNSDKPYALLRKLLEKTGMAAIGKVTMSTKEWVRPDSFLPERNRGYDPALPDEVSKPSHFAELKDLPEAGEEVLALMTKIVDKMTMKDLDSDCTMTDTRNELRP